MDKDALGSKKESTKKNLDHDPTSASPLIFLLAVFSIIVLILFFFKDKIFKNSKGKNLQDLVTDKKEEEKPKVEEKPKQETVSTQESKNLLEKFSKE